MIAKFIVTVLASAAVGAAGSAIVYSSLQKDSQSKKAQSQSTEERSTKQDQDKDLVAKNSEINRLKAELAKLRGVEAEKSVPKVEVKRDAKTILAELPGLYKSNDRLHQRRRIYMMETLVDLGETGLGDIQAFLNEAKDAEPDWRADLRQQMAERFGLQADQVEQIQPLLQATTAKFTELFRDGGLRDLPEAERREKLTSLMTESQEAIKQILTPEQLEKFSGDRGMRGLMDSLRGGGGFGGFGGGGENPGGGNRPGGDRRPSGGRTPRGGGN